MLLMIRTAAALATAMNSVNGLKSPALIPAPPAASIGATNAPPRSPLSVPITIEIARPRAALVADVKSALKPYTNDDGVSVPDEINLSTARR